MDFNFSLPHPKGAINVSVTGATPQAAVVSIQLGCEIAAMMGGAIEQAPEPIVAETQPEHMTVDTQRSVDNAIAAASYTEGPVETVETVETDAQAPAFDSAGVAFDPELHTGTLNKNGTWRLKKGAASKTEADEGNEPAPNVEPTTEPTAAGTPEATTDGTATSTALADADEEIPEISDTELQRYCGRLAQHFGGSEGVFALAAKHVPDGEMPRPTAIKDQAARHAFIKEAQEQTGVIYHG